MRIMQKMSKSRSEDTGIILEELQKANDDAIRLLNETSSLRKMRKKIMIASISLMAAGTVILLLPKDFNATGTGASLLSSGALTFSIVLFN